MKPSLEKKFIKVSAHFFEKMQNKEKRNCIIELFDKKADWENWSKEFLSHDKYKGYKIIGM